MTQNSKNIGFIEVVIIQHPVVERSELIAKLMQPIA